MRKSICSLLIVVFALFAGACAGRQVRTSMPVAASAQAAPPVQTATQAAPEAGQEPAEVTPTPPAPTVVIGDRRSFQERIDAEVRRMLDENDAWIRAEAEKIHQPHLTPSPPNNDEVVAALRAHDPTARRTGAAARKPETLLAASAAPDPASSPPPEDAASVASESSRMSLASAPRQPVTVFVPDASIKAQGSPSWDTYLMGAALAAGLGILAGLLLARRRSREFRSLMRDAAFKDVPDGTLLVQEIRGGAVHRTFTIMAKIQLQKAAIDPALAEQIEKHWFEPPSSDAATAANDEEKIEPSVSLERPLPFMHDEPEPSAEPAAPAAPPEAPPAPAPSSAQISSQGLERHSVCGETDLKVEAPPKDVDAPARTIIFEDHSAPSN